MSRVRVIERGLCGWLKAEVRLERLMGLGGKRLYVQVEESGFYCVGSRELRDWGWFWKEDFSWGEVFLFIFVYIFLWDVVQYFFRFGKF